MPRIHHGMAHARARKYSHVSHAFELSCGRKMKLLVESADFCCSGGDRIIFVLHAEAGVGVNSCELQTIPKNCMDGRVWRKSKSSLTATAVAKTYEQPYPLVSRLNCSGKVSRPGARWLARRRGRILSGFHPRGWTRSWRETSRTRYLLQQPLLFPPR